MLRLRPRFSFFFFSFHSFCRKAGTINTVAVLFIYCRSTVHGTHSHFIRKKILNMGPTVLFTHLKIILLQCFQFLVFSFSNNKFNPDKSLVEYWITLLRMANSSRRCRRLLATMSLS